MNPKLKNTIKYIIFAAIAVTLLLLTYANLDLEKIKHSIAEANFAWIILSFLLGYVAIVARGLRWGTLLEPLGYEAKPMNRVNAVAFGYLANLGIPRSGEVARCTALYNTDGIPVDKLFGTVILERVIDFVILLAMIGLTFAFHYDAISLFFEDVFALRDNGTTEDEGFPWLLLIAAIGIGMFLMVIFLRKRLEKISIFKKGYDFLDGMKDGFKSIGKLKQLWAFIGYTVLIWACYFFMTYVIFFSLPAFNHFTPADALLLFVVGGLAMIVPAPGGTGSYHFAVTIGVAILFVMKAGGAGMVNDTLREQYQTDGATFAAVVWSSQTLMIIFTGIIAIIMLAASRRNKQNALTDA